MQKSKKKKSIQSDFVRIEILNFCFPKSLSKSFGYIYHTYGTSLSLSPFHFLKKIIFLLEVEIRVFVSLRVRVGVERCLKEG